MTAELHQGYLPGCIGRITELHARYYAQHAGFGAVFESKVAREMAQFCERLDEHRDGLWLALHDGRIEGSIVIDASHAVDEGAHLRWFIVSDLLRGSGTGRQLLARALAWCDQRGYARTYLWTFSGLDAARHLYEACGFRLVQETRGRQWGTEVSEQRFERQLGQPRVAA